MRNWSQGRFPNWPRRGEAGSQAALHDTVLPAPAASSRDSSELREFADLPGCGWLISDPKSSPAPGTDRIRACLLNSMGIALRKLRPKEDQWAENIPKPRLFQVQLKVLCDCGISHPGGRKKGTGSPCWAQRRVEKEEEVCAVCLCVCVHEHACPCDASSNEAACVPGSLGSAQPQLCESLQPPNTQPPPSPAWSWRQMW